jgi:hypothetical protein
MPIRSSLTAGTGKDNPADTGFVFSNRYSPRIRAPGCVKYLRRLLHRGHLLPAREHLLTVESGPVQINTRYSA